MKRLLSWHKKFITVLVLVLSAFGLYSTTVLGLYAEEHLLEIPLVEQGRLDLTDWKPLEDGNITLEGTWEIYWRQLLEPPQLHQLESTQKQFITVPFLWSNDYSDELGIVTPAKSYATLRTVVETKADNLGLRVPIMLTSSKVWVNGQLILQTGTPGRTYESYTPFEAIKITELVPSDDGRYEIVVQVANHHVNTGGINKAMIIGDFDMIQRDFILGLFSDAVLAGIIFFMFVYHLIQFRFNKEDRAPLYFSLFCFGFVVRTIIAGHKIILFMFPAISWIAIVRLAYITFVPMVFFILFIENVYPEESEPVFSRPLMFMWGFYALLSMIFPDYWATQVMYVGQAFLVVSAIYLGKILIAALRKGRKDIYPLILATLVMCLTVIYDILFALRLINGFELSVIGTIFFMITQSYIISARYSRALNESVHFANEASRMNKELTLLNIGLEDKVKERTQDVRNLLENAGQGFLSFGSDLMVKAEHSSACDRIFGEEVGGKSILELFRPHISDEAYDLFSSAFKKAFEIKDIARKRLFLSLTPEEIKVKDRYIFVENRIIETTGASDLMLILTDISEKKALEKSMDEERNNLRMVVYAITNQSDVRREIEAFEYRFMDEMIHRIHETPSPSEFFEELYRSIHTYKGTFAQYCMLRTENQLHAIEDHLSQLQTNIDAYGQKDLETLLGGIDPSAILSEDKLVLSNTLGNSFFEEGDMVTVSVEVLESLEKEMERVLPPDEGRRLIDKLRVIRYQRLDRLLLAYDDYMQSLALSLDKALHPIKVTGDIVFLDPRRFRSFLKTLIHIFKNMLDHGIEEPVIREALGKDEAGMLVCHIEKGTGNGLILTISNDGAPIIASKIKEKALEKGLDKKEVLDDLRDEEIFQLIFLDRFTTKSDVNRISGRGVGLSAVRRELDALKGTIQVQSSEAIGTRFLIELPHQDGLAWAE